MTEIYCSTCGAPKKYKPSVAKEKLSKKTPYQCRNCYINNPTKGESAPRWAGGNVVMTCTVCGKQTTMFRNVADKKQNPYKCVRCNGKSKTGKNNYAWKGGGTIILTCEECKKDKTVKKYDAIKWRWLEKGYRCTFCKPKGEKSPAWKGGIGSLPYAPGWNKLLKDKIRTRDGYECKICGEQQRKDIRLLPVHHINYDKLDISESNLITLCQICHTKTNYNREKWKSYFSTMIIGLLSEQIPGNCQSLGTPPR